MVKTKNRAASRLRAFKSRRRLVVRGDRKAYRRAAPHPDRKVVERAEKIFAGMGMTPADAVAIFYRQTVLHGDFPITELVPNEETQAAIREARAGIGLIRGRSVAEMLREAEGDDCVS